jgi:uncharacterized membrane protein YeaQ/YmgE (transglycosylase-associated protein family)
MPSRCGKIESFWPLAVGGCLEFIDIPVAVVGAFALAWIADQLGGRRGLFGASLVAATGAVCGWFLAVRVFAVGTMDDWAWVGWALGGAAVCLLAYHLARNTR